MHLHTINKLLKIQDIYITDLNISDDDSKITLQANIQDCRQACPYCQASEEQTILKGKRTSQRLVRHLDCLGYQCYLSLPEQRLSCKACGADFTYRFSFVGERSRFTIPFQEAICQFP